jgi:hypothetical protein
MEMLMLMQQLSPIMDTMVLDMDTMDMDIMATILARDPLKLTLRQ